MTVSHFYGTKVYISLKKTAAIQLNQNYYY